MAGAVDGERRVMNVLLRLVRGWERQVSWVSLVGEAE
jgi:hypothetical protein